MHKLQITYEQLLGIIQEGIWVYDADSNITFVNPKMAEIIGYEAEEMIGKPIYDFFNQEVIKSIEKRVERRKSGISETYEEKLKHKEGHDVYVEIKVTPIIDDEGDFNGGIAGVSDITDRKIAEEALRSSEQELRTITDNMTDVIAMADVEGKFTYLSESNYQLTGYKPGELLGKSIFELIFEEDLSKVGAIFQEGVVEGRKGARVEYRVRNKNGKYTWVETIGSLVLDDNGQPSGVLFTSRDISDRVEVEKQLKESEEIVRGIVDSAPYSIQLLDLEGYTVKVNEAFIKLFDSAPPTDYTVFDDPHFETSGTHKNKMKLLAKGERVCFPETYYNTQRLSTHLPDKPLWIRADGFPLFDINGKVKNLVLIHENITDRKIAEEQIRYIGFHDQLTNLYNRHYFEDIQEELKYIPLVSVIMTDVNGLKLINDTYGHEAGDEMLKKYAVLLRESFKQSDLIFRWGGDEFIIILKNTKEAKSWELCNRLIKYCGESFVKEIPLSISVGISSKLHGEDIDEAIKEAEDMMYKNKLNESKSSKNLIMKTLLETLSEKSFETKEHIERMGIVGRKVGERLSFSPSELSRFETLTMLHDIGKINLDSHILLKETALTDEEWEEIKKHPEVGYRITRTAEEFAYVAEEILAHHERWDGKGYPQGLQGEDIPYLARLLNIIDSYDVMSNGRPYKKKMTSEEIIEEIERCSGKQFDPDLAEEFIACLKEGTITY